MPSAARGRRWTEERPSVPTDLRLVPAAAAIWAGALIGLLAGDVAWWVAVLTLIMAAVVRLTRVSWQPGWLVILACLTGSIVVAALHAGQQRDDPLSESARHGSWATLVAAVVGFPRAVDSGFVAPDNAGATVDQSRWRMAVKVVEATVAGRSWSSTAAVTIYGQGVGWSGVTPGERIAVSGRLGEQDFGVAGQLVLHARDPPTGIASAPWWDSIAADIREHLSDNAARLDGDAAGLLPGLVVGDTSGISERLDADAKTTGITHLLAVSGSHFAILCGMVVVVVRRFGPRSAAVGGTVTLLGLVILVGPQPSVLRAALMGGIGMLALLTGRSRSVLPALATAVIVLLFVDPELAVSVGFTLSVLATAGLILIAPAWSESLQRRGVPPGWADLLAVPAAAQIVTMPVIVLISGSVSVVGVLANLLVAPVVPPALLLGVMCALTGPWWSGAAAVLAHLSAPLLGWIAGVAHTLARWPSATVPWPASPTGAAVLAGMSLVVVMLLRHRTFRELVVAVLVGVLLVAIPTRVIAPGWPATGWLFTACEVGQGDAMILSTGEEGTAVVVDTGPDPGLVDSCLDRLGIGTIALLVLTHLHADHIDGLPGAIEGRTVGAIAVGPGRAPAPAWSDIVRRAGDRGIALIQLNPGLRWASGELALTVLGPRKTFSGTDSDPNNDSVVLMAERSGVRTLMTGDIEIEAQQALLNADTDLDADVLKVPHHGSAKLLDRFVRAVSPTVAVIGVGADNDYGHPSPRALELLARDGVRTVLRTDQEGDVSVGLAEGALTTASRGASAPSG